MYKELKTRKIVLVHDYLLRIGGAERVLKVLHEMFPQAPIYTVVYDKSFVKSFLGNCHERTCPELVEGSFLQKLPLFLRKRYKYFSFLIPSAVEGLDFSEFDIVLSSCSAFSKGIITRPDTIHMSYCHTPTRFLWDWTHSYYETLKSKGATGFFARIALHFLRLWDKTASDRVDYFIANSKHVASRVKKYYGREAKVIYPPAGDMGYAGMGYGIWDSAFHTRMPAYFIPHSYFLIVSQLRPYKQIDIAVEAFKKLGFPLVIIGGGDDEKRLKELAGGYDNIKFLGRQDDGALAEYYKNCRAFIFPGEEDFGLTMVEAMSAGKPVLALRRGGAREILIEGVTGEFFDEAHHIVLADGLRRLIENYKNYSPLVIKKRAEIFSREKFEGEVFKFIEKCCKI